MTAVLRGLALAVAVACTAGRPRAAELPLEAAFGRPVRQIVIANGSRVPDAEIRSLFLLGPGAPYDPAAVQRSLELLAQKTEIRNVVVRAEEAPAGLTLRLEVSGEPLVRSIGFEGETALPEKDLRGRLRAKVDQPAHRDVLDADARALQERYAEEGYPGARVEALVEGEPGAAWVRVVFRVVQGAPERIVRVTLPPSAEPERERILALLGLGPGTVASQTALREGVRRVLAVYRRDGYLEARAPKARFEPSEGGAALVLPLVLGDPVDLRFEGIDDWDARPLADLAADRFGEVVDEAWAEQVAGLMGEALRADGYRNALIAPRLAEEAGHRRLTFLVQRGPRVRVGRVVFQGQRSESSRKLKSYMSLVEGGLLRAPPFTQEALDRDLKVLTDYYVSRGFLDARVTLAGLDVPDDGDATLRLAVEEGVRYRLGHLSWECDGGLTPARAAQVAGLEAGRRADPGELEQARARVLAELTRGGYADASVEYQGTRHPATGALDVVYRVRAGEPVRFGKIVVSGNARTRTPVILRELTFKEGGPWSAEELLLSRQKLFRLGYFQRVRIEALDAAEPSAVRDVRVSVEEQDAGAVTFGAGYGSEEGVKGFAELSHSNLFGSGREARVRGDIEGRDWSYSLGFREPWLFGYKTDLDTSFYRQYQSRDSYNLDTTAFKASLDRRLTGQLRGTVVYTLSWNSLSDVAQSADVSDIDQYLLSSAGPIVAWDSRDDPFNPTTGFQHQFQAEWALKALGSEVQFSRYVGSVSGYASWRRVTLALLARGGFAADVLREKQLPINKRFFLGGRTSVRGFDRDSIGPRADDGTPMGGDTMINLRAEVRFPLWKSLGGDLFWDAGNVWNRHVDSPNYLSLRQGAGGGLRYQTPVGPIAFDVGFKLDREEGEAASAWNFTIGNVF